MSLVRPSRAWAHGVTKHRYPIFPPGEIRVTVSLAAQKSIPTYTYVLRHVRLRHVRPTSRTATGLVRAENRGPPGGRAVSGPSNPPTSSSSSTHTSLTAPWGQGPGDVTMRQRPARWVVSSPKPNRQVDGGRGRTPIGRPGMKPQRKKSHLLEGRPYKRPVGRGHHCRPE